MSNKISLRKKELQSMGPELSKALPKHVNREKFERVLATVVLNSDHLVKADSREVFKAAIKCAELGLMPNGKEAAIICYGRDVQFQMMYEGMQKLVRNSGELETLTSKIVYKGEEFEYFVDHNGEHFKHTPDPFNESEEIIGAYCIARMKDGGVYMEFMSNKEIKAVEGVSKAKRGPWSGPFRNEMIKKTVFKRLYKRLPKSTDIDVADKAIEYDNEIYDLEVNTVAEEPKVKEAKKSSPVKLKEAMKTKMAKKIEPQEEAPTPDQEPPKADDMI